MRVALPFGPRASESPEATNTEATARTLGYVQVGYCLRTEAIYELEDQRSSSLWERT